VFQKLLENFDCEISYISIDFLAHYEKRCDILNHYFMHKIELYFEKYSNCLFYEISVGGIPQDWNWKEEQLLDLFDRIYF
jgi:hypothetical protein